MTDRSKDEEADLPKNPERRPRPQYGEYATPQEQAKIIADSLPPVSPLLVAPSAKQTSTKRTPAKQTPAAPAVHPASEPPTAVGSAHRAPNAATSASANAEVRPAAPRRRRRWDLILTAVLLGYASVNVIAQFMARDMLTTIVTQFFVAQGIGDYTPTALTTTLGNSLNVVTLALFVLTVLATTWMLRRGRVAFWVPIAGGVAATIVALVFVVILLQSDPAFTAYLAGLRR